MKIRLFKTSTCPYCQQESIWLKEKKVPFEEVFVDRDPVAAEEMVHLSGQMGVPVTEVTEENGLREYVLGFDQPKLVKLLKI